MNKVKHLEMIELIIERMAKNSFQLKGWSVAIATLIITLSANNEDKRVAFISLIPLLSFWFLDAYYLQLERVYTVLYRLVAARNEEQIDFCMDVSGIPRCDRLSFRSCLCAFPEMGFYLPVTIAIGIIIIVLKVL